MIKEEIRQAVLSRLAECKKYEIGNYEKSIFESPMPFEARDLAYVCLRMREDFEFDLEEAAKRFKICSVNEMTQIFTDATDMRS